MMIVSLKNDDIKIKAPVAIEMTGAPRSIVFKSPALPTEMEQPATV